MRRFVLDWKVLGCAWRFRSEIVNYADDLCALGKAPAAEMLATVERLMAGLKLAINERKTRCLRSPEEAFEFLGYRIGRIHRPTGKGSYIGTRPGKASVQSICRRDQRGDDAPLRAVGVRGGCGTPQSDHHRMGKLLEPWTRQPVYNAVHRHAVRRLRQWLCGKRKVKSGKSVRFSDQRLQHVYGLVHLTRRTMCLPSAKA